MFQYLKDIPKATFWFLKQDTGLKSLPLQGLSESKFMVTVYVLKKSLINLNFIISYCKIVMLYDAIKQSACLEVNPITLITSLTARRWVGV